MRNFLMMDGMARKFSMCRTSPLSYRCKEHVTTTIARRENKKYFERS